ncbi:MAG: hypothetical protein JSV91_15305, partial [Phycisphaerales bacterium]
MMHDRFVQLIAAVVMAVCLGVSGTLLPAIIDQSDDRALRYTDVSVEGAPPFVALGTVIGAVRGLIVDYLWIKVNIQKEKGLFYEVMADADLITKLQPRFAAVWVFHGHNMAYNISVATHTQTERWEWVQKGIRLVRDEGIRHNPNDLLLHKELAFWFAHKIDGYADDAHLYYKTQFCREWHLLLGLPPDDYQERIAWIKEVADAPETLDEAERRVEGVKQLVEDLRAAYPPNQPVPFGLNRDLLNQYTWWKVFKEQSAAARILGAAERMRAESSYFTALDNLATDPARQDQWKALLSHVRKRVLREEYNMDPQLMYEYTRDLGPLDWRHPQAHGIYWSRRGSQFGEPRVPDDEVYRVINNDRIQVQGMQALSRTGRMVFDPFSSDMPARFPDPRWIDTIDREFERLYIKHFDAPGAGGDTFIDFLKNYLSSAIRQWYREGEREKAQQLMDRLDSLFGTGAQIPNDQYKIPLDVFVRNETREQYQSQPYLAPSDVMAALRHGYLAGIVHNRPDILQGAVRFADEVTEYFQNNEYFDFNSKFGTGRMRDLITQINESAVVVFAQLMIDRTIDIEDRLTLWAQVDRHIPDLRVRVYD